MSSIFSVLAVSNAFVEIMEGYAKLHEGSGVGGLSIGLQQGTNLLGTQLQATAPSLDGIVSATGDSDSYEFSDAAMDYAFAFQTQQVPPVSDADATDASSDVNSFTSASPSMPYQPSQSVLPSIEALSNLNNPYPFGNEAVAPMLDVYA